MPWKNLQNLTHTTGKREALEKWDNELDLILGGQGTDKAVLLRAKG